MLRDEGKYTEALANLQMSRDINEKAYGLKHPRVVLVLYNMACTYSLAGMISEALASLEKAMSSGLRRQGEWCNAESDPDFDNIRSHEDFQRILNTFQRT